MNNELNEKLIKSLHTKCRIVFYRDEEIEDVLLSDDLPQYVFQGGGASKENANKALMYALRNERWQRGARCNIILIGDEPSSESCRDAIREAVRLNVKIHTVSQHMLPCEEWARIADATKGKAIRDTENQVDLINRLFR